MRSARRAGGLSLAGVRSARVRAIALTVHNGRLYRTHSAPRDTTEIYGTQPSSFTEGNSMCEFRSLKAKDLQKKIRLSVCSSAYADLK